MAFLGDEGHEDGKAMRVAGRGTVEAIVTRNVVKARVLESQGQSGFTNHDDERGKRGHGSPAMISASQLVGHSGAHCP